RRRGGGRGWCPCPYQTFETGIPVVSVGVRCVVPLPRFWLQMRCVSRQFERSYGEPPRLMGTISSTSARMGCGTHPVHGAPPHLGPCSPVCMPRVLSTHSPHSAQCVSVASTRARSCLRLCPLAERGFVATSASSH